MSLTIFSLYFFMKKYAYQVKESGWIINKNSKNGAYAFCCQMYTCLSKYLMTVTKIKHCVQSLTAAGQKFKP